MASGPGGSPRVVECRIARTEDFAAVGRMLELYQHDLSDIWDQDLDAHGQYGYDLSRHAQAASSFAHVLLVDGRYAGFALVAPAFLTQAPGYWMEQFFVVKKYRRAGLGESLALHAVRSHPGAWEVGQMTANRSAQAFWRQFVTRLAGSAFSELEVTQGAWQGVVQRFHQANEG